MPQTNLGEGKQLTDTEGKICLTEVEGEPSEQAAVASCTSGTGSERVSEPWSSPPAGHCLCASQQPQGKPVIPDLQHSKALPPAQATSEALSLLLTSSKVPSPELASNETSPPGLASKKALPP